MLNSERESLETLEMRENEWMKSERQMRELYEKGAEKMLSAMPDRETLFENGESCLCCIDEGTDRGLFRSAGSGILMSDKERARMVEYLQAMGIKGVRSHEGCGAAEKYCLENGIDLSKVEEVAQQKAMEIAAEIGVPYLGHIEKLARPKAFHYARTAYYDGSGQFNQQARKDHLPPGFVISRRYMGTETSFENLKLSIQIALGEHGFGKKITPEKPMMLVAFADPHDAMFDHDAMKREMDQFIQNLTETDPELAKRVRVDVAIAPIHRETRN